MDDRHPGHGDDQDQQENHRAIRSHPMSFPIDGPSLKTTSSSHPVHQPSGAIP
jgi:hypothetical protein